MERISPSRLPWGRVCRLIAAGLAAGLIASCEDRSASEILTESGIAATPDSLVEAAVNNQAHVIDLLLDAGVLPDTGRDEAGHTALMIAARNGYTGVIEQLAARTADFNLVDQRGMTALSHSICSEEYDIARQLLAAGAVGRGDDGLGGGSF